MTPERWQEIDKLLEQALEHEPARRGAFLDVACQGDVALRREVESLLSAHGKAEGFTEAGLMRTAARGTGGEDVQLLTGRQVGHYQILSRLGEGGMGVVYKARDQHLDRYVAIKVLPPGLVADPDRKRRFVQEAKAASALKHPNIITIHDIASDNGNDFIVMEYVDGKTLGQTIPRRGIKLNEVLKYAIQIADGLAKAHAVGIIHRDLKPGNVMVGEDGLGKGWPDNYCVWRVPAGGGVETLVVDSLHPEGGWQPVNDGIYFISRLDVKGVAHIQFKDLTRGEIRTIAPMKGPPWWGLAISPDRHTVLYSQSDDSGSDLMLVENFR